MVRLFYRYRLFWLGLPGLLFLLWTWNHSMNEWFWAEYRKIGVASIGGTVLLQMTDDPFSSGELKWHQMPLGEPETRDTNPSGISTFYRPIPGGVFMISCKIAWFAPAFQCEGDERGLNFAHWFLILVYLVIWLGVLTCWQRRKGRLQRLQTAMNVSHSQ